MIRLCRVSRSSLGAVSEKICLQLPKWRQELALNFPQELLLSLPEIAADNDYISFYTTLQGQVEEIDLAKAKEQHHQALDIYEQRKKLLCDFLNSSLKLQDYTLEESRQDFFKLLNLSPKFLLVSGKLPVFLPIIEKSLESGLFQNYEKQQVKLQAVPFYKRHLPCILSLSFFLALLFLAWYFLLRPWPYEGTLMGRIEALLGNKSAIEQHQRIQHDIDKLLAYLEARDLALQNDRMQEELALAQKERDEALAQNKALEEKQKLLEEQQKLLEEQRLKDEQEKKALLEKQEKLRLEKERQEALLKQQKQAKNQESFAQKALPKCEILRKEGKMPQMVIAFDGSESMLQKDVGGGDSRLSAAIRASEALVQSTDKNISIGLVEINGCPMSKNHGFFSGGNRSALISAIRNINPYRYDGKTPLVHGLNTISSLVDGVKAEAVGVLISDGEDTCPFTSNMNVCIIAKNIHASQPKLKIHTILIGKNASQAACIAEYTGGKVYSPKNAAQIVSQLKAAGASVQKVCKE